jgi:four helix bundle protein
MDEKELKQKTKQFALRIINCVESLPKTTTGMTIGNQLIRSGTSVGANYRAACRARSKAEFASKLGICEEEADESLYWMELLAESGLINEELIKDLYKEGEELTAIMTSSRITLSKKKNNLKSKT